MNRRHLAVIVLASAAVSACDSGSGRVASSTDGPTGTATPSASSTAIQAAVTAYSRAYLGGQAERAFGYLSDRCQRKLGQEQMDQLVTAARQTYGQMSPTTIRVLAVTSSTATVSYTFSAPALNQKRQRWTFENGWKYDAC